MVHAVGGRVLIYVHKEQMLRDVEQRYPARRYVMVDDKVWLLAAAEIAGGVGLVIGLFWWPLGVAAAAGVI